MAKGRSSAWKSWLNWSFRLFVGLGVTSCIYLATIHAVAEWHFRKLTSEGFQAALRWNSRDPRYYAVLARTLRFSGEGDPNQVIGLAETATRLGPHSSHYWAELGSAYEWLGKVDDARRAYERARQLFPNSPDINWKLGNFYLRAGRTEDGLRALQKTLLGDPEMRQPTFDLALRASGDLRLILAEMIPPVPEILCQFLNYLVASQRIEEAGVTWSRLLDLGVRLEPKLVFPYLDALIQTGQVDKLAAAWAALAERNPTQLRRKPLDANLLVNGNFEDEILNGGLDWRVVPIEGSAETVDPLVFFDGTRSLRIQFDGTRNLNYEQVFQYVPVKSNSLYRFIGYVRTQAITTDSGPRFQVYDAYNPSRLFLATDGITGTTSWSPQQLEFRTGPDTRLLLVRIVRVPSRKFDNQIKGIAWVDHVTLNLVE